MGARAADVLVASVAAPSPREITIERLSKPSPTGECVAVYESNGLLVTSAEAETLIAAGARDHRARKTVAPRKPRPRGRCL